MIGMALNLGKQARTPPIPLHRPPLSSAGVSQFSSPWTLQPAVVLRSVGLRISLKYGVLDPTPRVSDSASLGGT